MAYDKNGWLQLPSGRAHKLPRWLAYRWMQLTLAVDYLDFEVVGIAPDDQPVLQTRDGLMTANYAFGDRDNSGQYPLKQLRDCAAVDRGQSHVLSQELYNEALEDYFEQCSKTGARMQEIKRWPLLNGKQPLGWLGSGSLSTMTCSTLGLSWMDTSGRKPQHSRESRSEFATLWWVVAILWVLPQMPAKPRKCLTDCH